MNDVESLDLGFYNSLRYVLDSDPAPLELTFSVLEESFGEVSCRKITVSYRCAWNGMEWWWSWYETNFYF